ncbi:Fur family transcriptional regulator [Phenylobacterium sp. SCN 70-31]|uniref:Fur family transcriptional regulator n=1 Tax=Phenylobacterium sp. SCN 70-31 TaxID=1660129 RepID=UPI00086B4B25|nr:Fur family transcriptional regulator [Phenylobacterium sp. SCN 70-31]ODT84938.1 MAG: hypothetical protein ABS78_21850 [Phenylobacterium sp. SCN 70-31]
MTSLAPSGPGDTRLEALWSKSPQAALARAESRCLAAGERWTEPRRRTFELLVEAGRPVKAYDLVASYGPGRRPTKPPTVYRALAFLIGLGLVHKVETGNAFIACPRPDAARHAANFLICEVCGRADELDLGMREPLEAIAQRLAFRLDRVVIEARGVCAPCRFEPRRGLDNDQGR